MTDSVPANARVIPLLPYERGNMRSRRRGLRKIGRTAVAELHRNGF
jgi:hypothetical protein